jgi:sigma-B regulation protein RsbU (phosphoserine phosphatase)
VFVTILLCVLDTASGRLAYCSAGHTTGIIRKADGAIELLDVRSMFVGAYGDAVFDEGETTLEKGDLLVAYTDGVTEARRGREFFGEDRLARFIKRMPSARPKGAPKAIFKEVLAFSGGGLSDDVAIVAVARKGRTSIAPAKRAPRKG